MQYKLIVSDFDGTLRQTAGGVSEENIEAIGAYVKAGGIFALCTGRMMSSILPYAKRLGLKGLIVAYQGAIIQDIESGQVFRDARIPNADAVAICRCLEQGGNHIHVYDGDVLYVNKDDDFKKWYERACSVEGILTDFEISKTVEAKRICPHKILVVCSAADRDKIFTELSAKLGDKYYVTTSMEYLVEITAKGCNKGDALRFLADYFNIPIANTIAIGDNYNDLPMIRAAGLGVAVGNAEQTVQEQADVVTRVCDEGGVGYIIRKYGLGESL